jgi:hypothetical protein
MIKLTQTSETFGDCTALYSVEMDKPYTVKEFIKQVLKRKEWGYIGIEDNDSIFGEPKCEYKGKTIITENLPEEILSQPVVKVRASGGWSRMDYIIEI